MSQLALRVFACALLSTVASAAPTVAPPFDVTKQAHIATIGSVIELVRSNETAKLEEALGLLERSIAANPRAGDTDYAVAWAARAAARLCKQEVTLGYYTIMRRYFAGGLSVGANGAYRDWPIHLSITRAYLERCPGAKATLAKMDKLDRSAKPMPTEKLFANLTPQQLAALPQPPVDRDVGVVGAWRFDPPTNAWVPHVPVTVTPKIAKVLQLPGPAAPDGLYTFLVQEPGTLADGLFVKGTPDCTVRKDADLADLDANAGRYRCVPGRGLTLVPRFDAASILSARDLELVKDMGERIVLLHERARPTPKDVQIYFQREGKSLAVRATSDYGRTLPLEIERLLIFDPKSSTWKPLAGAPKRLDVQTFCTGCDVVVHHRRRATASDSKIWTPVIADSVPALLHLRGTFGGKPITQMIPNGTARCIDVDIGTRPGMMAVCVPDGHSASARFVPPPPP